MADNVNITPGSGDVIAADEIGGAKYQRVKIGIGADGSAADLAFGQAVAANSLPVVIASDQMLLGTADAGFTGIVTVAGAGTAVQGSAVASTNGFVFKAHPDNTDSVWMFGTGGAKARGFPLNVGDAVPLAVTNLNQVWFDADVSGEKICWIKL